MSKTTLHSSVRTGSALLVILLAVAIVAILYFMDLQRLFKPSISIKGGTPGNQPWVDENLILGPEETIKMPEPPKFVFTREYSVQSKCTLDGSDRGIIMFKIIDGHVEGTWKCDYTIDKRNTDVNGVFSGNIDVNKTYTDEKGEDPSKLFFIAKGKYFGTIYNARTNRGSPTAGELYVTGWIHSNGNAEGKATITQNKEWAGTYTWNTGIF